MTEVAIRVENLTRDFGAVRGVDGVVLEVPVVIRQPLVILRNPRYEGGNVTPRRASAAAISSSLAPDIPSSQSQ